MIRSTYLVGVHSPRSAARFIVRVLEKESTGGLRKAGIAISDGCNVQVYRGRGVVSRLFHSSVVKGLKGGMGIGFLSVASAAGGRRGLEPVVSTEGGEYMVLAFRGTLSQPHEWRRVLRAKGAIFHSALNSELMLQRLSPEPSVCASRLCEKLNGIEGEYSCILMTKECLVGGCGWQGNGDLCIGKLGRNWVLSSGAAPGKMTSMQRLSPGEVVVIRKDGSVRLHKEAR